MKVALAYLHPGHVTHGFMDSVCRVLHDFRHDIIRMALRSSADITRGRNAIVEMFLRSTDAGYLWWLDSDIVFTPDTLERLIEADKPIASAVYLAKNEDGSTWPVAMIRAGQGFRRPSPDELSDMVQYSCEVAGVGMGCCLIRRDVLVALGTGPLWPYAETVLEGETVPTEDDITFCLRAKEKGFGTFLVPTCQVGHVKDWVMMWDDGPQASTHNHRSRIPATA